MVALARSHERVSVRPSDLDRDPWKLNVENGTIDLRTGKLHTHDPADLITKLAPVAYDPSATCPEFEAFLDVVMAGDADLISFLQRAVGYTLTGDVREQVLFLLYGTGANGKTTFVTTMLSVLGDYGLQAEPELLVVRRGDVHPTGVADLVGSRLAVCAEVEQGRWLAEALTKQLTGGDRIKARRMHRDFFEFDATHKLYLAANHKPVIRGTDHAIWRRILLVPFAVTIPAHKQDRDLLDKLKEELPGILAWAVRGCLEWKKSGLAPPAAVKAATDAYREEMDTLADFIADRCTIAPGAKVKVGELRKAYEEWCEKTGEKPLGARLFGQLLTARGHEPDRDGNTRYRQGIQVRDDVPF